MFALKGHTLYHVQFVTFLVSEISRSQMVSYISYFFMGKTTGFVFQDVPIKLEDMWQYY
jgi:hypothetical protein